MREINIKVYSGFEKISWLLVSATVWEVVKPGALMLSYDLNLGHGKNKMYFLLRADNNHKEENPRSQMQKNNTTNNNNTQSQRKSTNQI